jgi:hypothetical protein
MKTFVIVLRSWRGGIRREMVGVNLTNVQCKHIQKCHNEPPHAPVQLMHANKNALRRRSNGLTGRCTARNNKAKGPWSETPKTMRRNKSFVLFSCFCQVFCHSNTPWNQFGYLCLHFLSTWVFLCYLLFFFIIVIVENSVLPRYGLIEWNAWSSSVGAGVL